MEPTKEFDTILTEACTLYTQGMTNEFERIKIEATDKVAGVNNSNSGQLSSDKLQLEFQEPLAKLHSKTKADVVGRVSKKYSLDSPQQDEIDSVLNFQLEKYSDQLDLQVNSTLRPVLGIDLGTTFCCVAVYHEGKVQIVRNSMGQYTTPSYIAFSKDAIQEPTMGQQAKDEANIYPENTIFDAKRLIGRKFDDKVVQEDIKLWPFHVTKDEQQNPKIKITTREKGIESKSESYSLYPEEISGKLLAHLKEEAEEFVGNNVRITDAVIAVPAYFNNGQRQATKDAGRLAGLNVLQILNEPTAAAITYSLHRRQPSRRIVLIFDLGGGTFDVSFLSIEGGSIRILAVGGDTHLGGEDFDSSMVSYCIQEFRRRTGVDLSDGKDSDHLPTRFKANKRLRRLRNECEKQKIFLSSSKKVKVALDTIDGSRDLLVEFTRERFEQLIQSKLDLCIKTVDEVLSEIPDLKKEDVDDIVLVGGSTHIPKLQQMLRDYFDGKALSKSINPDEAVAWGAATLSCLLSGQDQNKNAENNLKPALEISDVTPLSLGIQVHEGDFSPIVPKNTKIPFEVTRRYKTRHDFQSSITIVIYEGEDKLTRNNHLLGKFILSNIPMARARQEKCYVTMRINCDGILYVEASSMSQIGNQNGIKISMHSSRPNHTFNTIG